MTIISTQCFALSPDRPARIQLLPPGPFVAARDGRSFMLSDPKKVVAASELPLLVDWEHRSEWGDTKAAGWVTAFSVEPGGVFGELKLTPDGARDVSTQAYRYSSPSLLIDSATKEATKILAVALTNRPALSVAEVSSFAAQRAARFGHTHASAFTPPQNGSHMSNTQEHFSRLYPSDPIPASMEVGTYEDCRARGMSHEAILESHRYNERQRGRAPFGGGR